jgi:hypothetical protein
MGDLADKGDLAIQTMRRDSSCSFLVQVAMVLQERIMDEQGSDLASLHGYYGPSQGRESSKTPGVIDI